MMWNENIRKNIYIFIILTFYWQACQNLPYAPEIIPPESDLRFKIVDTGYNDLIDTLKINNNKIKFYYKDKICEHSLDFIIYLYEDIGPVLDVKRIPELSSSGIKVFYLKFNNYPVDSLYMDIRQKSNLYHSSEWFSYIEMKCNGIDMEYNQRYLFYYIKR